MGHHPGWGAGIVGQAIASPLLFTTLRRWEAVDGASNNLAMAVLPKPRAVMLTSKGAARLIPSGWIVLAGTLAATHTVPV